MAAKNPPITGAAQSVTSAHMREMSKGGSDPAAPPAKAERKKFQTSKPKAEPGEPTAPSADKPDGDEDEGED